jgi:3-oxoacyl-[acyl-carrier protein] reductase
MDLGLEGKTALVFGGGGGLGHAIAKSVANEGANVAVAGIRSTSIDGTVTELKATDGKCIGLIWDLVDPSVLLRDGRLLHYSDRDRKHVNCF